MSDGHRHRTARTHLAPPQRNQSEESLLASYLHEQDLTFRDDAHDLSYLDDAVVMIVGGGGTIGSHLAAELLTGSSRQVVMVDSHEDGLYAAWRNNRQVIAGVDLAVELVDIRDQGSVRRLVDEYQPDVIFHYANYKSAALGEVSSRAFLRVNLAGTLNLLDAARQCGSVRRFVYISSDKAERPTTTYGRTKRLSELLLVSVSHESEVRCATMRYCNVLDAAGSYAIPTFRRQISERLPVTVRRRADGRIPDRYFVDITTAARAALVAGSYAGHGPVFTFDTEKMSPISMLELAATIARATGRRVGRRWSSKSVTYTDLMPGEKLSELLGSGDGVPGSPLARMPAPSRLDGAQLISAVRQLVRRVDAMSHPEAATALRDLLEVFDEGQNTPTPTAASDARRASRV